VTASEPSERVLVERFLRTRSTRDFHSLYALHERPVYRFVLRLCGGDGTAAEEVVQETWVRAITSLSGFAWQASLRTWLHGIALNCWREAQRARRPVELHVVTAPPREDDRVLVGLDLERAILALPTGFREVLLLHDVEGLTHAEIAAALGIEVGTSKSQLARARRALRQSLTDAGGKASE
jgi:RNA polymerase sigma-70 factor (ECF subfamily)